MTKGEIWKRFFENKGWLKNDVIAGDEKEILRISLSCTNASGSPEDITCETALILKEEGILCHETKTGTVFFQWDDIIQVKVDDRDRKKSWL